MVDLRRRWPAAVGSRDAVVWRGRRLRYGELAERAARLANVLHAHGLGSHRERPLLAPWESGQDLVGCYLLNGPEYLEATLGGYAAARRAVQRQLPLRRRRARLPARRRRTPAPSCTTLASRRRSPRSLPRLARRPLLLQVADGSAHGLLAARSTTRTRWPRAVARAADLPTLPDDLYVLYTGGTTGMPKGTLWRQADIWVAALGGRVLGAELDVDGIVGERGRRPRRPVPAERAVHARRRPLARPASACSPAAPSS